MIPTEPIGSIPRPPALLTALSGHASGAIGDTELAAAQSEAGARDDQTTEATVSPASDGDRPTELRHLPDHRVEDLAPDGAVIPSPTGTRAGCPD